MDVIQLYQDFSVDFVIEGHKHSRPGWVNTECPWCVGNPGYHLGYELNSDYFYCWRCGWHPTIPTISKIINLSEREVYNIIKQYGLHISKSQVKPIVKSKKEHHLPSNVEPLGEQHKKYLERRGFDSNRLEHEWRLFGTGPMSLLDSLNFKHRIIIPIIWDDQEVSFTSRDITEKSPAKYITCPIDREIVHHKHIIYGKQHEWKETGICVEGPTDVWRLGERAVCTFGIEYTPKQMRVLSKAFKRIFVVFDDDPQAVIQANKLVAELKFRGVDSFRVDIEGDPGGMKQEDADYLVKQLIQ